MHILPARLKAGDTIGIVSPSSPVTDDQKQQLNAGVKKLESLGFKTKLSRNALANSLGFSASAGEKAADINEMFADQSVQAIFCSQGGQNANGVLPLLDYELIKKNPKIFFGISDITVLLNGIYAKTGLVTFHGNDVIWGFGRDPMQYEIDEMKRILVNGQLGPVKKNLPWRTIRGGSTEGLLLGGNVTSLGKILGTPSAPDFTDAILFLEDYGEEATADKTSYGLHHLDQAGVFQRVRGVIFGYYKTKGDFRIEEIAREVTDKYTFPVMQCDDFGHNTPNTILPVGARAKLDAGWGKLSLPESYLL